MQTKTRSGIVTDSPSFIELAEEADRLNLNRRVYVGTLKDHIDPDGKHVVAFSFPTGPQDSIIRAQWLVKLTGQDDPVELWLDSPWKLFDRLTHYVTIKVEAT